MTIETARRASLEFVCVFGQDALAPKPGSEHTVLLCLLFIHPRAALVHKYR